MGVTYDHLLPTDEVHELIQQVIADEFPVIAKLTTPLVIKVSLVRNDKPDKPALSKNGRAEDAIIDVVRERDREITGPDVHLRLDSEDWSNRSDGMKAVLISAQLRYLEFPGAKSIEGNIQPELDSLDRPKVKRGRPDFRVEGFYETVKLHGDNAPEKIALNALNDRLSQQELPFAESLPTASLSLGHGGLKFGQGDFDVIGDDAKALRRKSG